MLSRDEFNIMIGTYEGDLERTLLEIGQDDYDANIQQSE